MTNSELLGIDSNTYANIFTFMGLPLSRALDDGTDVCVMGIPFDLATSGRSGTRFGPNGVRQASAQLRWEERRWPWQFTLSKRLQAVDYGDLVYEDGNGDDMLQTVELHAGRILAADKALLSIGGDHFVTLPLLRAHAAKYGPLALLHFDAHTDTEESDAAYNHGSMFYHAPMEGLIDPLSSVQVGIRTDFNQKNHGFTVLDASWVNNHSVEDCIGRIKQVLGDRPVYLSFDIDCLDPAFAPGTGTPVSGGLTSDRALQIIRGLSGVNIVGMDVVEVAPAYDHAEVTSLAAATLALEMLYLKASQM
ncbi:agmatinase [Aliamphritea hakodatensis]|uniref:agmatinase n=1 Tax=Aliamphritea hakodatensis TaxID=2895352 RepID=UPI0022FD76DA|nr:agmatinase [Aliamphritea hakodatensis]